MCYYVAMEIIFSDHSKTQNLIRKIPRKLILEVIKNPQKRKKSFKNRQLLQRKFSDKILEVVTITEDGNLIIITQYWLEEES